MQEDNDIKHMWKVALDWRPSHRIEKIDWPSMSLDLAPIKNNEWRRINHTTHISNISPLFFDEKVSFFYQKEAL